VTPGPIIAIDGPAGSGKSSVSRSVATSLGVRYLDTGAMYRALTWAVVAAGIDPEDAAAVTAFVQHPPVIDSGTDPSNPTITVDGVDVADAIRESDVTSAVSAVSAVPAVRSYLVAQQQKYVSDSKQGIVVEGRDIGSVVLPHADVKLFLTADPSVRAQRRAMETSDRYSRLSSEVAATEASLRTRDAKDSSRAVSPLTRAEDAIELDTTEMTFEEVVSAVTDLVHQARQS